MSDLYAVLQQDSEGDQLLGVFTEREKAVEHLTNPAQYVVKLTSDVLYPPDVIWEDAGVETISYIPDDDQLVYSALP